MTSVGLVGQHSWVGPSFFQQVNEVINQNKKYLIKNIELHNKLRAADAVAGAIAPALYLGTKQYRNLIVMHLAGCNRNLKH